MVGRRNVSLTAFLLLMVMGCHDVTEYSESGEFGAVILDATDLSVLGHIAGMDGARTVVSMSGSRFLVGCTSGRVYDVDSEAMKVQSSSQVTSGTGGGLDELTKSPAAASVYMTTGSGKLLEMDTDDFSVLDEFSAGPSPSAICRSPEGLTRIYVTDREQGTVREVDAYSNLENWSEYVAECPVAITRHGEDPPIMITAHGNDGGIHAIRLDWIQDNYLCPHGTFADVTSAPFDTIFCAAEPCWESGSGRLLVGEVGWVRPFTSYTQSVSGHPTCVCSNPLRSRPYFYVACADGDRTIVAALNYDTRRIEMTVELDGYPWDITTHMSGDRLIVITSL